MRLYALICYSDWTSYYFLLFHCLTGTLNNNLTTNAAHCAILTAVMKEVQNLHHKKTALWLFLCSMRAGL